MARKPQIGTLKECPVCGAVQMEVRLDKNNHPYAFCEICTAQILTHGRQKALDMLERTTPIVQYEVDHVGKVTILPINPHPEEISLEELDPVPEEISLEESEPEEVLVPKKKQKGFEGLM